MDDSSKLNRRDFLKQGALAGTAGLALSDAPAFSLSRAQDSHVRIGVIGTGGRGRSHLRGLLDREDTQVPAICDIRQIAIDRAKEFYHDRDLSMPKVYTGDDYAYRDMLAQEDLDGVIVATPWLWHAPMGVDAMKEGIRPAIEVPMVTTVDECWNLVKTSQDTGTELMFLENVCYRRDVMAVLNMVRQGLFGEIVHARCGYQHNLQDGKVGDEEGFRQTALEDAPWRSIHSLKRNGDLYPTHGVGPMAKCLEINRGNRFMTLSAMATKSRGLHDHAVDTYGADHPTADFRWQQGDIVVSQIKCANGETLIVSYDTNLPRPYSLNFRVQGTRGLWQVDGNTIYLKDKSPEHDEWEPFEKYQQEYEHPLWKRYYAEAEGSGHDGMDWYVRNAFVESTKRGEPAPIDVYDGAAWSVIGPLSEESVARGGSPVQFPDFTDGRWMERKPILALENEY